MQLLRDTSTCGASAGFSHGQDPERALAPLNRIAALDRAGSWPKIIADLDSLAETEIEHDRKRFVLRSAPRPAANLAAVGVALPPTVY